MKKKVIIATVSVAVGVLICLWVASATSEASWLLGGWEYARTISAPERIEVFPTTGFLAKLTNGPQPEHFVRIEPGISLPKPAIERVRRILTDPESYSERLGDTAAFPPEIILRLKRGQKSVDLEFSDDLKEVSVRANGAWKILNCEPARHDLERAIGPFLKNRPASWHVD